MASDLGRRVAARFAAGRKEKILHDVKITPGTKLQSIPDAQKAIKAIKAKFPGIELGMVGKSMVGKVPAGQIADLKAFLSDTYGATLADQGPIAKPK